MVFAPAHVTIKISVSRNCQYKTIYQTLNISNKTVQEDILWLLRTESILLKKALFYLAAIHDLLLLTKLAAIPIWVYQKMILLSRSCCIRAFTGFISKLIFSSNILTIHLTYSLNYRKTLEGCCESRLLKYCWRFIALWSRHLWLTYSAPELLFPFPDSW